MGTLESLRMRYTIQAGQLGFDALHIDIASMQATPGRALNSPGNVLGNKPVQSMFYPTVESLAEAPAFALA